MTPEKLEEIASRKWQAGFNLVTTTSRRKASEIHIQVRKLRRLLLKAPTGNLLGGGSVRKFQTKQRKHDAAVGQQLRHVGSLTKKTFKEWKRIDEPQLKHRYFQKWQKNFEDSVAFHVKRLVEETKQLAE
jgi:hypothetical protein